MTRQRLEPRPPGGSLLREVAWQCRESTGHRVSDATLLERTTSFHLLPNGDNDANFTGAGTGLNKVQMIRHSVLDTAKAAEVAVLV